MATMSEVAGGGVVVSSGLKMKKEEDDNGSNGVSSMSNGGVVCVSKVVISSKTVPTSSGGDVTVVTNGTNEREESPTKDEMEDDELSKLNYDPLPGSALVRQKSATLTGGGDGGQMGSSPSHHQRNSSPNAFMNSARNNLRRSFTLPRGLLLRKSGQTGPASENQNGSFVRNIFLTLVRSKSVRKKKGGGEEKVGGGESGDGLINGEGEHSFLNKLHGFPPGFTPAAVGLKNQGNTCFMNAIVQCLSHTDPLAKYLVTENYKSDLRRKHWIKNGKSEVTEELASILKSAWLKQNTSTMEDAVARFKSAVEKGALQWRGSEQHDAQEFFLWLLDRLHEDLNQASSNKYKAIKNNFGRPEEQVAAEALANHLRCNNSIIQDIFGAQFRSSLTCPGCGKQSATFDPFVCVSLPIPQAKQEVPVYVNIIYLSQQPRQVKLGLSVSSSADIKELKQLLAADTGIEENDILLTEIDGEGFHRTFTETQLVSALANNEALYCIETPQLRETTESDGAFLMVTWTNIVVTNDGTTRVRFGSTFVTQIARETGFVDLQKVLLKEMAGILQPGILVSEQKDPVFSIKILDGSPEGGLVDPSVEHPLYMESVDHALSLCDEDVPPHIKLHLEWVAADKDKIIADDSESVEEHSSVIQTRLKHSEETMGSVTLGECFDLYTTAEQLSAEDAWHCPHCNRKEQGTKMIGLWTAPPVLVVHLKRFRQAAKGRIAAMKLSSVVDFPVEGLDLGPHVAKRSNKASENGLHNGGLNQASSPINGCFGLGNWKHRASFKKHFVSSTHNNKSASANAQGAGDENMLYDLYAVCNHHGKDVLGGHYTAYCRNPVDGSWWSFDDTRVTKLSSPSEIKTASAYILFYTKRSPAVLNSQPVAIPFQQPIQHQQHWCRSLIKKYHKIPPSSLSNSNSAVGDCLTGKMNDTNGHENNAENKKESTDGAQGNVTNFTKSDAALNDTEKVKNTPNNAPVLTNGYHHLSSSTASSSSNKTLSSNSGVVNGTSSSSAPLARMEDVGIGVALGYDTKELQIVSTV